jgi:phosphate starvation-inducible PhoH-like protein
MNLHFEDAEEAKDLFGPHNDHLKAIEKNLEVKVHTKGSNVVIEGDELDVELAGRLLKELHGLLKRGYPIYVSDIDFAIRILSGDRSMNLEDIFLDTVYISSQKKVITPKSVVQKEYIDTIRNYDMVIGIGPAGTGKTYLAMAMALSCLMRKAVKRIILARPAVEAGERLGFLPGDLYEKVNPYLRPLYDALHDMLEFDQASKLMERGIVEVAPLAFMRGRTLNDSFVILDEAQNTKPEQMKMFLTRMGFGSKVVITGDITQVDLPDGKQSGLIQVQNVLKKVPTIKFVYFSEKDVIRHPLVQDIIKAYEEAEQNEGSRET